MYTHTHTQNPDTDSSTQGSEVSVENSTGSGYAATGSASSVDSVSRKQSHDSHMMQNGIRPQFSYPLEKLLAQPLSCEIDCDDIGTSPLSLSMEVPRPKHHHHGNALPYSNGSHGNYHAQRSGSYNAHTKNGYSQSAQKRTNSESKLVNPTPLRSMESQLSYHHRNQSLGERRYQSGSIAVDV